MTAASLPDIRANGGGTIVVQPLGWQPIGQIALDEVWSAMRFKPMRKVGK